jgi:hypothetical protein
VSGQIQGQEVQGLQVLQDQQATAVVNFVLIMHRAFKRARMHVYRHQMW